LQIDHGRLVSSTLPSALEADEQSLALTTPSLTEKTIRA